MKYETPWEAVRFVPHPDHDLFADTKVVATAPTEPALRMLLKKRYPRGLPSGTFLRQTGVSLFAGKHLPRR